MEISDVSLIKHLSCAERLFWSTCQEFQITLTKNRFKKQTERIMGTPSFQSFSSTPDQLMIKQLNQMCWGGKKCKSLKLCTIVSP